MKKYLEDLKKELLKQKMSEEEINEILQDHKEMIEEAIEEGLSEEELEVKFGNPEKVAQELKNDGFTGVNVNDYVSEAYDEIEGYQLFKGFTVNELVEVDIRLLSEDLEIYPYDGQNIEIHYKGTLKEEKYDVSYKNGVFQFLRNNKQFGIVFKEKSPDFVVRFPKGYSLKVFHVVTVSGDAVVKGIETMKLELKSTSGDFNLQGTTSKETNISSVSGDFIIEKVMFGKTNISAVSGDYECNQMKIDGNLTINTVSGDFEMNQITAGVTDFKTVSGDLKATEFYVELVNLQSVSGDIELTNSDKLRPVNVGKKKSLSGDIKIK